MAWCGCSRKGRQCLASSGGGAAGWSVSTSTPYIPWQRRSNKALQPFSGGVYGWVFCAKNWQLGYLETGLDAAVATGYDPLGDDAPELARTMAASVQQRIAFGERAGQKVRRIGSGFGAEGEPPTLSGARCASVHGFSLHANTQVSA